MRNIKKAILGGIIGFITMFSLSVFILYDGYRGAARKLRRELKNGFSLF